MAVARHAAGRPAPLLLDETAPAGRHLAVRQLLGAAADGLSWSGPRGGNADGWMCASCRPGPAGWWAAGSGYGASTPDGVVAVFRPARRGRGRRPGPVRWLVPPGPHRGDERGLRAVAAARPARRPRRSSTASNGNLCARSSALAAGRCAGRPRDRLAGGRDHRRGRDRLYRSSLPDRASDAGRTTARPAPGRREGDPRPCRYPAERGDRRSHGRSTQASCSS